MEYRQDEFQKLGRYRQPAAIEHREKTDTQMPLSESSVCADDGALAKEWSATEFQDWWRETLQLANQACDLELSGMEGNLSPTLLKKGGAKKQCLKTRAEVIRQRWQSAKAHIPESLLNSLQQILQEEVMYIDLS